jgi:hypothetical protein
MSRAFVEEDDNETAILSDRPVSGHRVTQSGLVAPSALLQALSHGMSKVAETSMHNCCLTSRAQTTLISEKDIFFVA